MSGSIEPLHLDPNDPWTPALIAAHEAWKARPEATKREIAELVREKDPVAARVGTDTVIKHIEFLNPDKKPGRPKKGG